MIKRKIFQTLIDNLAEFPAVVLLGPRQVGKTTLALSTQSKIPSVYLDLESPRDLNKLTDPESYFDLHKDKLIILDEVQRVPEIFLAIKQDVDEHRIPGRYALTGSANPLLIPRLGDSLAGRMEIIELFPLSQGELIGADDRFIDWAFSDSPTPKIVDLLDKKRLYQKCFQNV